MNQKGKVFSLIALSGAMLFSFAIIGKNFDFLGVRAAINGTVVNDSVVFGRNDSFKSIDDGKYSVSCKTPNGTEIFAIINLDSSFDLSTGTNLAIFPRNDTHSDTYVTFASDENGEQPFNFQKITALKFTFDSGSANICVANYNSGAYEYGSPVSFTSGTSQSISHTKDTEIRIKGASYGERQNFERKLKTIELFYTCDYDYVPPVEHSVSSAPTTNGSISLNKIAYFRDEEVRFNVNPDSGYFVSSVSTSDSDTEVEHHESYYSFVMPDKDIVISATFEEIPVTTYTVSANDSEHGEIVLDVTTYSAGDTVYFMLDIDEGYCVDELYTSPSCLISENDGLYSFSMPASDVVINASFVITYSISVNPNIEHGSVSVDKVLCLEGETVTVTATPETGYELDTILVDENEIEGTTFEMPNHDVEVSATFVATVETHNVSIDSTIEHGSVSVNPSQCVEGENVTVTATPDSGYELDAILVDGVEIEGITFDMPNHDVEVSATFVQVYSITIDSSITHGTVTASTNQSRAGNEITLTVTPAEGYEVESVSYNSIEIMPVNDIYSFTMPSNVVIVTATFEEKSAPSFDPYVVLASSNISGTDNNGQSMSFVFSNEKTGTQSITKGFVSPVYTFNYELEKKSDNVYCISFTNVTKKSGTASGVSCMVSNCTLYTVTFDSNLTEVISAIYEYTSSSLSVSGKLIWSK